MTRLHAGAPLIAAVLAGRRRVRLRRLAAARGIPDAACGRGGRRARVQPHVRRVPWPGWPRHEQGTTASLAPSLVAELRRHKLAAPPNEHDLVFASQAGTPIDPDNLYRAWARTLRKAGLRHLPMHSLRHTAVSLLIEAGANPKQLQKMVGHGSIQLTFDTYGHLMPDSLDGLTKALDAIDTEREHGRGRAVND